MTATMTTPYTVDDVLTEHAFVPPCDWRIGGETCYRAAAWAVTFHAPCPKPHRCDRATKPALWCDPHMTLALHPNMSGECEVCGHVFDPFAEVIASHNPLGGDTHD
jgi:hypothetical protein